MHVAILGAGGLGCAVGGCLAQSGVDVTLVARPRHVAAINRGGLRMTGMHGDRLVTDHLRAVATPDAVGGDIDYLILATKTLATDVALEDAAGIRPRVAAVLSVQNSVHKDARLARWIGPGSVIGAATTEAATMAGDGVVDHVGTAPTSFYLGELDGSPSDRVDRLCAALTRAGITASATSDIAHVQWEKQLQISIVSGFSATVIGFHPSASFAHGIAVEAGAELYVRLASELLAVYRALGYGPEDFFHPYSRFRALEAMSFDEAVDDMVEHGRQMVADGVLGLPSLHEDLRRGRRTEVDEALGTFVAEARRLGIDVPAASTCLLVIRAVEALANPRERTGR